jgi:hypothetical protein
MSETTRDIISVDQLRSFVRSTLCEKENLVEEQFRMGEAPLVLCGSPCGLQFSIRGPRSIRLSAVWAADANVIYFYDARGERFLKVRVNSRFEWLTAAAA